MPETPDTVMIVAGETSGDSHAAGLVRELKRQQGDLHFFGSGGPALREEGVELLLDVSKLEAIGPWAAMANAGNYWKLYRRLKAEARQRRPKLAILVDFPDFNLPLAKQLKKLGVPVCYFISPQVWAWRKSRLKQIQRFVDLMLVIFPFEESFYRENGVECFYIGNPTARRLAAARAGVDRPNVRFPKVALLPGSRRKEVDLILPAMLDAARAVLDKVEVEIVLQQAPNISRSQLEAIKSKWEDRSARSLRVSIFVEGSEAVLAEADCALVKSGTSTLEALLLGVPFAMVYKLSPVSWWLLKPFVKSDTYCLANLVAGRRVVPEFVQHEASGEQMAAFLLNLLSDVERRKKMRDQLATVASSLGTRDAYNDGARRVLMKFFEGDGSFS